MIQQINFETTISLLIADQGLKIPTPNDRNKENLSIAGPIRHRQRPNPALILIKVLKIRILRCS